MSSPKTCRARATWRRRWGFFLQRSEFFCAFRFGHTMVRAAYDHNRNFGRAIPPAVPLETSTSFARLFLFTGYGHALNPNDPTKSTPNPLAGQPTLPFNWIIEWDRLSNKADPKPTSPGRSTRAWYRPSTTWSTRASGPKSTTTPIRTIGCCGCCCAISLSSSNLLRGYLLSIPTGQAVAKAMGVPALSEDELRQGNTPGVNTALEAGGFSEVVANAVDQGLLVGRLGLTDHNGNPLCAAVRPPLIEWSAGSAK